MAAEKKDEGMLGSDSLKTIGLGVLLAGAGSAAGFLGGQTANNAQYVTRSEVKVMISELAPYSKDKPVIEYRLTNIEDKLDEVLKTVKQPR